MIVRKSHSLLRRLGLALAVAAIAAPSAQAIGPGAPVQSSPATSQAEAERTSVSIPEELSGRVFGPVASALRTPAIPSGTGGSVLDARIRMEGPLGGPTLQHSRGTSPQADVGGPRPVGVIGIRGGGQVPAGSLGLRRDPATSGPPQYRIGSGEVVKPVTLPFVGRDVLPRSGEVVKPQTLPFAGYRTMYPSRVIGPAQALTPNTAGDVDLRDGGIGFGAALGSGSSRPEWR